MIVPYGHVLLLAVILFLLGAACAIARRNLLMILIGVEVMLNASALAFIGASLKWRQLDGQARPSSSSSLPWPRRKWRWAWL